MSQEQDNNNIEYNDYAVLIPYFDESWAVRRPNDSEFKLETGYKFTQTCKKYREEVEKNRESFNKANGKNELNDPMDNFILNPACYVAFGPTDGVGIVILDDFNPIFSITGDFSTIIDHSCIAFAPTLEFLGLGDRTMPFCEIHDLLNKQFTSPDQEKPSDFSAHIKDDNNEFPLMVITEFKLNSLAVLDLGLDGRKKIFQAMAKHIQTTLKDLEEQVNRERVYGLIDEKDINTLKCVLLDGQGTTDIVLLTFCRNYSVAMSLITALRSMNFESLDLHLENKEGELHQNALENIKNVNKKQEDVKLKHLHIFYSTYSTLTFTYDFVPDFESKTKRPHLQCCGYAEAYGLFKIKSGHCQDINKAIPKLDIKNINIKKPAKDDKNYHLILTGQYDRIENLLNISSESKRCLLPIKDLISLLFDMLENLKGSLSDISTSIATPVLTNESEYSCIPVGENHGNTSEFYHEMHERLFFKKNEAFDIEKLEISLKKLRIPMPLCRSVIYLYQVFASCLADPLLFNNALELYNVFDTIYDLLTNQYTKQDSVQKGETDNHIEKIGINEKQIKALCRLLEVMRDYFDIKTNLALPGDRKRDMAIDFRGGLNKFIAAADALVQCGMELFNQKVKYCNKENEKNDPCYVGIIKLINFDPQTNFYQLNLGSSDHHLACIDINASHLFNPAYFLDYLREIGYMIFNCLLRNGRFKEEKKEKDKEKNDGEGFIERLFDPHYKDFEKDFSKAMRERLQEVFADMLTHLFIFEADTELFIKYYLIRYITLPLSIHQEYGKQVIRLNEVMFRAFLIKESFQQLREKSGSVPLNWKYENYNNKHPFNRQDQSSLFKAFDEMFESYERYVVFPQDKNSYKKLEKEFKQYRKKTFMHLYFWISWKCMAPLLREALGVYQHCVSSENNKASHVKEIGEIMRTYIKAYYDIDDNKRMHLYREPQTGKVSYNEKKGLNALKWNEIQLDPLRGGLFCVSGKRRRQQIKYQIEALRGLWGISTKQLAANEIKMMEKAWPLKNNERNTKA